MAAEHIPTIFPFADDTDTAMATLPDDDRRTLGNLVPEAFEHIRQGMEPADVYEKLIADHPDAEDALHSLLEAEGITG